MIEVFVEDAESVIDLVAWPLNSLEYAGGLGLAQVRNPATFIGERPLRIHQTPLAWLKAGCNGSVILRETSAFLWLRRALGNIAAEDLAHGHGLARLLHSFFDPARILVPRSKAAGPASLPLLAKQWRSAMPHLPKPNGHDETLTPLPEAIRAQERSRRDRALNGEPDLVTEDSVALRFVEDYRDRLHYCHAFSYWYEWDGAIRRRHRTKYIFQLARELARELSQTQPDNVRSLMRSTSFVAGVARFARSDPAFAETAERWDKDPMLLGTPTGTVDLKTG